MRRKNVAVAVVTMAAVPSTTLTACTGGPAAQAGVQPGDVIIKFGGQDITSLDDFLKVVGGPKPGQHMSTTVSRGGQQKQLMITAAAVK